MAPVRQVRGTVLNGTEEADHLRQVQAGQQGGIGNADERWRDNAGGTVTRKPHKPTTWPEYIAALIGLALIVGAMVMV
jgi:hypothetical protein